MMTCIYCDETILATEARESFVHVGPGGVEDDRVWVHQECMIRQVCGSIGHQQKVCSCYGGRGDGDPAGLTMRQAAVVAARWFQAHTSLN